MGKTTGKLTEILKSAKPKTIESIIEDNKSSMLGEKPFANYFKKKLKEKHITKMEVFERAGISATYGYKILSEEKRTANRDLILGLALAAHFTLDETQRALKIYGMSPLYPRYKRDALLITVFNNGMYNLVRVNQFLSDHGEEKLSI